MGQRLVEMTLLLLAFVWIFRLVFQAANVLDGSAKVVLRLECIN